MIRMKKIGCLLFLSLMTLSVWAQKESADVRTGNKLYNAKKYTDAEVAYRKGLQKNPKSFEANYNLGNAMFKQGKYPEALEHFNNSVALQPKDKARLAAAYHNIGNSLLADKKLEESINAYKMALKSNPKDDETRYNLAYAQSMLKKQNKDKDKNKDKKKDQKKEEKKEQPKDQPKPQPKPQQKQPQMSKENAQQILDALMQDEKNAQEKAKKQPLRGQKKADRDW